MKCPVDGDTLVMSERSGVEIDYCPRCRGVWLDRGELDKILERAVSHTTTEAAAPSRQARASSHDDRGYFQNGHGSERDGNRKRKKESWLSELFD